MAEYVCELCESKPFRVPVDEVGAALMQQHLKSEHDLGLVAEFKRCGECDQAILCKISEFGGRPPATCKEHS
jgi:hypothetical protein